MIIILGALLKHNKIINDNFVAISSKVIFTITLPTLIFLNIASLNTDNISSSLSMVFIMSAVVTTVFIVTWFICGFYISQGKDKAAFMQGVYRSNFATLGLAAAASLYGDSGLAEAALLLAFVVPLYNILGIIALTLPIAKEQQLSSSVIYRELFGNPIAIGAMAAIPFAAFNITIPILVSNTASYLADLTIPLALLGIGGVMQLQQRDYSLSQAISGSLVKVVIMPLVGMSAVALLQPYLLLEKQTMGILFIVFACPTTSASFIMAQAMGANGYLASGIVVISTALSALTMSLGFYLLTSLALI
ncbi:MAG: malonate transporter [Kiritimatiellia bacterium]|jgi:malonate transporter